MPEHLNGPDWVRIAAHFVPQGQPVPALLNGADWMRIPAAIPRPRMRRAPGGQPWPKDRNRRDWPKDRWGRPICPLWDYPQGARAPGQGPRPEPDLPYRTVTEIISDTSRLLAALDDPGKPLRNLGLLPPQTPASAAPSWPAGASRATTIDGDLVAQEQGQGENTEGEEVRRELERLNRGFPGRAQPSGQGERVEPLRPGLAGGPPKVPNRLQPFTNPPQPPPPIPEGWVASPSKSGGGTIYHPAGPNPDAGASIRVMPPGATPIPGLENGYWVQTNKMGQRINPATGRTGSHGETHVPLPPPDGQ